MKEHTQLAETDNHYWGISSRLHFHLKDYYMALSILEKDAPVELLRDAFETFSQHHCLHFASTVTESGKPSIDYSMKVVVQVRCDQNLKGNLSPDIQMCSYVEEVL